MTKFHRAAWLFAKTAVDPEDVRNLIGAADPEELMVQDDALMSYYECQLQFSMKKIMTDTSLSLLIKREDYIISKDLCMIIFEYAKDTLLCELLLKTYSFTFQF